MPRSNMSDKALTAMALVFGLISIACCSAAVNQTAAAQQPLEGVDIAAAAAAAVATPEDSNELEGLLHWAIEHSDPEQLQEAARKLRDQDPATLKRRSEEMRAVIEAMQQEPSETDHMKAAIAELKGGNTTDQLAALDRLKDLVRPIDNANDLKPLGGIAPLIALLDCPNPEIQAAAMGVLATAASNNVKAQQDVAEECPNITDKLLQVLQSNQPQTALKGLQALGSFLRNSAQNRQDFFGQGGLEVLQKIFLDAALPPVVRGKALDLVTDFAKEGLRGPMTTAFLESLVTSLSGSLPGDWPALERCLSAASALTSPLVLEGSRLLAAGLQKSLDAARGALSSSGSGGSGGGGSGGDGGSNGVGGGGAAGWDEDDQAYAQELLQLLEDVERNLQQQQGAAGAGATMAAGAAVGRPANAAAGAAAAGGAADEQPEIVMLGPAKGAADSAAKADAGKQGSKRAKEAGSAGRDLDEL